MWHCFPSVFCKSKESLNITILFFCIFVVRVFPRWSDNLIMSLSFVTGLMSLKLDSHPIWLQSRILRIYQCSFEGQNSLSLSALLSWLTNKSYSLIGRGGSGGGVQQGPVSILFGCPTFIGHRTDVSCPVFITFGVHIQPSHMLAFWAFIREVGPKQKTWERSKWRRGTTSKLNTSGWIQVCLFVPDFILPH